MIFKKVNLDDVLANGMDEIMQSEEHKSIFSNPSAESKTVQASKEDDVNAVFNDLLKASELLDTLGFSKSAANVLKIADDLLESLEVAPADKEDLEISLDSPVASLEVEEELAELEELENLLNKED